MDIVDLCLKFFLNLKLSTKRVKIMPDKMYGNKTNWISKKKRLLRKEYSVINKTKRNPESVFLCVMS